VALSKVTLGQEWLMDTCGGRPAGNYLPGAAAAMVLSARPAARPLGDKSLIDGHFFHWHGFCT
jgi:hypothetical protein